MLLVVVPARLLSSCWLSVIPQASHRKGGLALWQGCTQPGGVLACPASTLLSQLKKTFLHRVRGKYPGQLEIGSVLLACPVPGEGLCGSWGPSSVHGFTALTLGKQAVYFCIVHRAFKGS